MVTLPVEWIHMIRKTRLFTPGPTPLLPAAQFAMAAADIHHRTPEFRALFKRVLEQLKVFVGTKNDVVILASSGTGAMEAAVSNLTSPGDRILVLSAGKFGERWTALGKAFGCAVDTVTKPYGDTFTEEEIRAALKLETRAVFVQATETSTGTRHDIEAIGRLLKEEHSEALLVVDAITGLGTTHLDMDGWGVDVLIGGSQKAVMIPPGLAYLAVSDRAWDRMEATYNPRYYFDLRKERKNARNGESAYTPAVALIAGLGAALDWIAAQAATPEQPEGDLAEGAQEAGRQCGTDRCHDTERHAAHGLYVVFASRGRGSDRGEHARRRGVHCGGQAAQESLWSDHHKRSRRDAGQDLSHRTPGLFRLYGHGGACGRAGTGSGQESAAARRTVWRRRRGGTGGICRACGSSGNNGDRQIVKSQTIAFTQKDRSSERSFLDAGFLESCRSWDTEWV